MIHNHEASTKVPYVSSCKWKAPLKGMMSNDTATACCKEHSRQVLKTCLRCVCAFPFISCPVWTCQFFLKRSAVSVTDSVEEIAVELSFHEALRYRGRDFLGGIWSSHQRIDQANVAEYKHNMTARVNDSSSVSELHSLNSSHTVSAALQHPFHVWLWCPHIHTSLLEWWGVCSELYMSVCPQSFLSYKDFYYCDLDLSSHHFPKFCTTVIVHCSFSCFTALLQYVGNAHLLNS